MPGRNLLRGVGRGFGPECGLAADGNRHVHERNRARADKRLRWNVPDGGDVNSGSLAFQSQVLIGFLPYFNQWDSGLQFPNDGLQQRLQPGAKFFFSRVSKAQPDHLWANPPAPDPFGEILVFGDDHCASGLRVLPNGIVFALGQADIEHMLGFVTMLLEPNGQGGRKLIIN